MALQEAEALQLMRAALENPHGTAQERSQRLLKAWSFLRRSAIPNADGDGILLAWRFGCMMFDFIFFKLCYRGPRIVLSLILRVNYSFGSFCRSMPESLCTCFF